MGKKLVVDTKARRAYKRVLQHYGSFLNHRLNTGKIDEAKFWRLQQKLTEWYNNFTPIKEVEDFADV